MYDRHPSKKSIKLITSLTVITRRVELSIDFYRLIDTIDNDQVIDIDSYRFIERFSDIDFYRLPTSGFRLADCETRSASIILENRTSVLDKTLVDHHQHQSCRTLATRSGNKIFLHLIQELGLSRPLSFFQDIQKNPHMRT